MNESRERTEPLWFETGNKKILTILNLVRAHISYRLFSEVSILFIYKQLKTYKYINKQNMAE